MTACCIKCDSCAAVLTCPVTTCARELSIKVIAPLDTTEQTDQSENCHRRDKQDEADIDDPGDFVVLLILALVFCNRMLTQHINIWSSYQLVLITSLGIVH